MTNTHRPPTNRIAHWEQSYPGNPELEGRLPLAITELLVQQIQKLSKLNVKAEKVKRRQLFVVSIFGCVDFASDIFAMQTMQGTSLHVALGIVGFSTFVQSTISILMCEHPSVWLAPLLGLKQFAQLLRRVNRRGHRLQDLCESVSLIVEILTGMCV